jgi:hypothetical protein
MTQEGAVLWLATGRYRAEQVISDPEKMDIRLSVGDRNVFSILGWPRMRWHFQSDDKEIEVDMVFDVRRVAILPDSVWPHNVFAMWWADGAAEGTVRYRNKSKLVRGSVFYDHPRLTVERHPVTLRQWYIYTPMRFCDGSSLVSYYAEDIEGKPIADYCFGLFIDTKGDSTWLPNAGVNDLEYDDDGLPRSWKLVWPGASHIRELKVSVAETSILRSWGAPSAPQRRKDFNYIPLVLCGKCLLKKSGEDIELPGVGLAEYWRIPGSSHVSQT